MKRIILILFAGLFFSNIIFAQCVASFSFTINIDKVSFVQGNASSPVCNHTWLFGDGTVYSQSAATSSPVHIYNPGTYTVKHIVQDSLLNCIDSVLQTITVSYTPACQASFSFSKNSVFGNGYQFYSTSSANGPGIKNYSWSVDGIIIPNAIYSSYFDSTMSPGQHQVCLSIVTDNGCISSYCENINNTTAPNCSWHASFTAVASVINPNQITFTALPALPNILYQWNFGDGYASTQKFPVHIYQQAGNYGVNLLMFDSVNNCFDSVRQNIIINGSASDSCTASFTYTSNSLGQTQFSAVSNQPIISYLWRMDSIIFHVANPVHSFSDTGSHYVCLNIVTNMGCTIQHCKNILIPGFAGGRVNNSIISYPNPAGGKDVQMNITMEKPGVIFCIVYNLSGMPFYTKQIAGISGNNTIKIPIESFDKGQYFVELIYHNQRKRSVFIKL